MRVATAVLVGAALALGLPAALPAGPLTPLEPGGSSPRDDHKNVLFIIVDDLRPAIGAYHYPGMHTPNMDRLAAEGTLFERAYVQLPLCAPSRGTIFTGRRPDTTTMYAFNTDFRKDAVNGAKWVTLPQYFRNNGYYVSGTGKLFHPGYPANEDATDTHGNILSFDRYDDYGSEDDAREALGNEGDDIRARVVGQVPNHMFHEISVAEHCDPPPPGYTPQHWLGSEVVCEVDADLARAESHLLVDEAWGKLAIMQLRTSTAQPKPWFVAVGFRRPHVPWVASKAAFARYQGQVHTPVHKQTLNAESNYFSWAQVAGDIFTNTDDDHPERPQIPDFQANAFRRGYYASVTDVDEQVGALLDELVHLNVEDRTMVVLTADHGFALGENNMWGKSGMVYEAAARVPLIIKVPWEDSSAGRRVQSVVESVGIYDTLVSLAQLPRHPGLEGSSFAELLTQESEEAVANSKAFVQFVDTNVERGTQFGVRTHQWCYNEHYFGPSDWGTVVSPSLLHEQLHPTQGQLKGIELFECSDQDASIYGFPNNLAEIHLDQYDDTIDHLAKLLRTNFKELPSYDLVKTAWGNSRALGSYGAARPPHDTLPSDVLQPPHAMPGPSEAPSSMCPDCSEYCRSLAPSFQASEDALSSIRAVFECTPIEERRPTFYMPELPAVCTDMSDVGAMDALTSQLLQRFADHPQRVRNAVDADVAFLPLSEALVRSPESITVSCQRCAHALASELQKIGDRPLFTSVGVPLPAVGSAVREPTGWCTKLWELPGLERLTVFSYEGFDYARAQNGATCEAVMPESENSSEYRDFQFARQDWSVSVPYPLGVNDEFQKMVDGATVDGLVAWQAKMLTAERPTLCGFLGGPRNDFRNVLIKGLPPMLLAKALGAKALDSQCVTLDTLENYLDTKYCIQPAGITVSRSGLYQSMAVGCVPVVFSHDPQCVWWEAATRSHLPHEPRQGFGAGTWSVTVNLTAAEANPAVIAQALAAISDEQYQAMRARVLALLPRITYFPRPLPGVKDAVDLVLAQMAQPRPHALESNASALLLAPVAVPESARLPLPPPGLAWGHPKSPDEECSRHFKDDGSSCRGLFRELDRFEKIQQTVGQLPPRTQQEQHVTYVAL